MDQSRRDFLSLPQQYLYCPCQRQVLMGFGRADSPWARPHAGLLQEFPARSPPSATLSQTVPLLANGATYAASCVVGRRRRHLFDRQEASRRSRFTPKRHNTIVGTGDGNP